MNWKTTLILLVLAVAGGAWMYYDLDRDEGPAVESALAPLLPDTPYVDATRLVLDRPVVPEPQAPPPEDGTRERIVFEKQEEAWFIIEPLQAPAARDQVEAMLEEPCIRVPMEGRKIVGPLEEFGLGKEALLVTIVHPLGQSTARIGRRSDFQGHQYAMAEGAGVLKLMDPDFDTPFRQPLSAYRARPAKGAKKKSDSGRSPAKNIDAPPASSVQP